VIHKVGVEAFALYSLGHAYAATMKVKVGDRYKYRLDTCGFIWDVQRHAYRN